MGMILGKVDFTNLFITLKDGVTEGPYHTLELAQKAGAVTINLGLFINVLISLVIVGAALFMIIKAINQLRQAPAAPAPATRPCPFCATEIPLAATRCPNCTSQL